MEPARRRLLRTQGSAQTLASSATAKSGSHSGLMAFDAASCGWARPLMRAANYTPSEREPQRSLHNPRRARGSHLPEQGVGLGASREIVLGRCVDSGVLRVVEGVVRFPAELEIALLVFEGEALG